MNLITALYGVVSQLPVQREQTHGGAQASDVLLSTTKPRERCRLYRRAFLKAMNGPEIAAAVDWDGRLIIHDSSDATAWIRADMDSYLMAEEFQ